MNNIILTQQDLLQLVHYIQCRGFRDPAVVAEILDHFACKVEERLNVNPRLLLETAMEQAHDDFGKAGFRPLVAAYEVQVRKKYKTVYRQEVKRTLQNIPLVLMAILTGAAVCKGFLWAELHGLHHVLRINDIVWLIITGALAAGFFMIRNTYHKIFSESILATASRSEYSWVLGVCLSSMLPARDLHTAWQVNLLAVLYAVATIYFIINFSARYHTVKKALAEFKTTEQALML